MLLARESSQVPMEHQQQPSPAKILKSALDAIAVI
jgi:hypothetical protein